MFWERCANRIPHSSPPYHYRIVEPFAVLRQRQQGVLRPFRERTEWAESLETMESFCGCHFSNELIDAMPVHLIVATGEERRWRERLVEQTSGQG